MSKEFYRRLLSVNLYKKERFNLDIYRQDSSVK